MKYLIPCVCGFVIGAVLTSMMIIQFRVIRMQSDLARIEQAVKKLPTE